MSKANKATNVYAELGFPDAGEMLVKAQLVVRIAEILRQRRMSQRQVAKMLGLSRPKLAKMLHGQFRGIGEKKMTDCIANIRIQE